MRAKRRGDHCRRPRTTIRPPCPPGKPPVPPKPTYRCTFRYTALPGGASGITRRALQLSHGAAARRSSGGGAVHLGLTVSRKVCGHNAGACVSRLGVQRSGSERRRTWDRSTHITRVPRDLHQGGVSKWMERAAGRRTSAQVVADRRQEDPRPPGSRSGPTMSRRSSHKGLSRSVRRCVERKDAMDGDMKLSWTQMGALGARHDVRIKRICGSCRGTSVSRHEVHLE